MRGEPPDFRLSALIPNEIARGIDQPPSVFADQVDIHLHGKLRILPDQHHPRAISIDLAALHTKTIVGILPANHRIRAIAIFRILFERIAIQLGKCLLVALGHQLTGLHARDGLFIPWHCGNVAVDESQRDRPRIRGAG